MKVLRFWLLVVLMALAGVAFAQSEAHKMDAPKSEAGKSEAQKPTAPPSEAQQSFATMKTLAGEWEGPVTVAEMPEMSGGKPIHVSLRVTSRGNVLVHELQEANTPLDATKYDHPVTMVYVDGDQLNLIHYCDAGNRPHMTGKLSPDGKAVEFTFVDISGSTKYGHMDHGVFTLVDGDHHREDWTFIIQGKQGPTPIHAHFDLHRVGAGASSGGGQ